MRRITLDVETITLLIEHRAYCAAVLAEGDAELTGDSFVFSADPGRSKPRNPDAISNRYRRMAQNLGIDTHIHALRHYSATELLSSGVDLRTVATLPGPWGGPYERRGYELEALLRRAGWVNPPEYDASARVAWLRDVLHERRHREGDIDRLVCRVCDPIEYGSEEVAEIFRRTVNEVISLEGLIITNIAGRPVLATLDRSGAATYSAPADLNHRLQELILDDETARLLIDRVRETEICAANGAYTFAIIGIGSFVEGLLQTVLSEREEHIRVHGFLDDQGKALHDRRISLHYLINLARSRSWIQLDAADFMHKVREYRNYVHPRVQQQDPQDFDRDSVMLCWAPVRAVLNDLEEHLARIAAMP